MTHRARLNNLSTVITTYEHWTIPLNILVLLEPGHVRSGGQHAQEIPACEISHPLMMQPVCLDDRRRSVGLQLSSIERFPKLITDLLLIRHGVLLDLVYAKPPMLVTFFQNALSYPVLAVADLSGSPLLVHYQPSREPFPRPSPQP